MDEVVAECVCVRESKRPKIFTRIHSCRRKKWVLPKGCRHGRTANLVGVKLTRLDAITIECQDMLLLRHLMPMMWRLIEMHDYWRNIQNPQVYAGVINDELEQDTESRVWGRLRVI